MATDKAKKEKDGTEVYLKNVRLSYPHLFEKHKATEDAKPKYSASFLIDPSTKDGARNLKLIEKALDAACMKEFKKPRSKMRFKQDRVHLKDGNEQFTNDGEIKMGYEDMMVVSASNPKEFTRLSRAKRPVTGDNSPFYGGCFVEAIIRAYGTTNGGSPGLFFSLDAVRFFDDGEPFGNAPVDPDAFDDYEDDEDDDDDTGGFDDDDDGEFDLD